MKIELDVHTHTIASGHAFSTLQEMAQAAAGKGLKLLGITEHSPGVPGSCNPIYFRNLHVVPRQMYGIELLLGAEINILDGEGNLDMDENCMRMLDIRIAGIHSLCYSYGTPNARENNLSILRLCKRYEVPVILGSDAHISFDIARYDYLYDLLQLTEFPESLIMNRDVKSFKEYLCL